MVFLGYKLMFIFKKFEVNYGVRIFCVSAIKIGVNVEKRKCER
jgi:hypothetical protein